MSMLSLKSLKQTTLRFIGSGAMPLDAIPAAAAEKKGQLDLYESYRRAGHIVISLHTADLSIAPNLSPVEKAEHALMDLFAGKAAVELVFNKTQSFARENEIASRIARFAVSNGQLGALTSTQSEQAFALQTSAFNKASGILAQNRPALHRLAAQIQKGPVDGEQVYNLAVA